MENKAKPLNAENAVFSHLITLYCREFTNWSRYLGVPKYDPVLGDYLKTTEHRLHLRIDFSQSSSEVFVPLVYFSATGAHVFQFPVVERNLEKQQVKEIDARRFLELALPTIQAAGIDWPNSALNLAQVLAHLQKSMHLSKPPALRMPMGRIFLTDLIQEKGEALPPIVGIIQEVSQRKHVTLQQASETWLEQYLVLLIPALLESFSRADANGHLVLASTEVELDKYLFPIRLHQPENLVNTDSAPENFPNDWIDQVILSHVLPLVGGLGRHGVAQEKALLKLIYQYVESLEKTDRTGLVEAVLYQRHFRLEGKLLPIAEGYHRSVYNPLHQVFVSETLLLPATNDPVFSRYFPKEAITIQIRPFDIERDLEMVHRWFHQDHAKAIWNMNWPLLELERFYRMLLPEAISHSYIGEINGEPTFNFEVYWAIRDIVGDYYEVLPTDYGTHLFIAPTDNRKKFPSATTQSILDWAFAQPEVGKLVGEGSVESLAALMNKIHVGFKLQRIIEMPHKKAHLNFCYREWYWAKFPDNQFISNEVLNEH